MLDVDGWQIGREARSAHAAKHAVLWNEGKKDEWIASWRTIMQGDVRMFDPAGHSIETFAWDDGGNLPIKTSYPMPETVGSDSDPNAVILAGSQ